MLKATSDGNQPVSLQIYESRSNRVGFKQTWPQKGFEFQSEETSIIEQKPFVLCSIKQFYFSFVTPGSFKSLVEGFCSLSKDS